LVDISMVIGYMLCWWYYRIR